MAFLLHSHHSYDQIPAQDVPQLAHENPSRLQHMPATDPPAPPPYDAYPPHVVSQPPSAASSVQSAPAIAFDHPNNSPASPPKMPKVGGTRCCALSNDRLSIIPRPHPSPSFSPDWALLSSDLQFIYMDPVFTAHLEEQADALAGKSLFDFIHPDEQASAKHDLGTVIDSRTLHGSVTRCVLSSITPRHTDRIPPSPACASVAFPRPVACSVSRV